MADEAPEVPLRLKMEGISKFFPGVRALDGVDLSVRPGEVVALLGENGAGKSTLMKILSGAHLPDEGKIFIDGQLQEIRSPLDAQEAGVAIIYQEFNLIPALSVLDNLFLGREKTRLGILNRGHQEQVAQSVFEKIGADFSLSILCRDLTVAQQQLVEIAKALLLEARIFVMDEPTAALTNQEVERLFQLIEDLKADGMGIIYISHRLDEIARIADRITVLRDGHQVGERPSGSVDRNDLIELMVGRRLDQEFPPIETKAGREVIRAEKLTWQNRVRDVSFTLHEGEIVGLTGLVGAGRTELAHLLFGSVPPDSGKLFLHGKPRTFTTPREAIEAGVCLLTEDRKSQGLVLGRSVRENFGLPNLGGFSRFGFIDQGKERKEFQSYTDRLSIKVPHADQIAVNLSGGNQQKVVLAKWLARNTEVLIFDEPTRGIDVGAKYEIYLLMRELARDGKAILMISSELPEVIGMCHRVLVMRDGRLVGDLENRSDTGVTQESILELAMDASVSAHS